MTFSICTAAWLSQYALQHDFLHLWLNFLDPHWYSIISIVLYLDSLDLHCDITFFDLHCLLILLICPTVQPSLSALLLHSIYLDYVSSISISTVAWLFRSALLLEPVNLLCNWTFDYLSVARLFWSFLYLLLSCSFPLFLFSSPFLISISSLLLLSSFFFSSIDLIWVS